MIPAENKIRVFLILTVALLNLPTLCCSQTTLLLPEDYEKLNLIKAYKSSNVKEEKVYKIEYVKNDTVKKLLLHRFIDENGNLLQEKDELEQRTFLNFFNRDGDLYRRIIFVNEKRIKSIYYYYNKDNQLIVTEDYDRLDSLIIRKYYNYRQVGNESICIVTTSKGDTMRIEKIRTVDPDLMIYQRYAYPDKLELEAIYVSNDKDQIIRKSVNNFASGKYEGWGYAYDENGNRFLGELYNQNQELQGTIDYHSMSGGLVYREVFRNATGRPQYEHIYEYTSY